MNEAEKECKKKKMVKEKSSVRTYKKEETNLPEWFNKEIEKEK